MTHMQRLLCALACALIVQPASAELFKFEGERTATAWVECLNDYITLDDEYFFNFSVVSKDNVTVSTRNIRQSGVATDSYENTWKFNGHVRRTTRDLIANDIYKYVVTVRSHDVLVGSPGGPGNLLLTYTRKVLWTGTEFILDSEERDFTCLP